MRVRIASSGRVGVLLLPALLLAGAIAGGVLGPRLWIASAADSGDEIGRSLRAFSQALAVVEQHYADPVDTQTAIYEGAIPHMLQGLDPHSSFFDAKAFARMQEDHQGRYAGVGMVIQTRGSKTVVVHPFPGTPAFTAGIRPGDVIVEVAGESMEGLSSDQVVTRLRGPEGVAVDVGYERLGRDEMTYVSLTRAGIPRPSVPVAFAVRPNVGFIRIETFNENTGQELDDALARLGDAALEGLIVDLRDNRGGILPQAVHVSGAFLNEGQTVVSQYGRASREVTYRAQGKKQERKFPLVVMVNCNSASASEIVAGALQDHDRALVVGSNTFGKGLVQSLFPMSENAGLALTTARYYTPSGRLIQRDYGGFSLSDYYNDPCNEQFQPVHDQVALTDHGRQVYSGGGIAPDIELQPLRFNEFQVQLARGFVLEKFVQRYLLDHPNTPTDWEPTPPAMGEFRRFLARNNPGVDPADIDRNLDYLNREIKRHVYTAEFDLDAGERAYFALDPEVEKALELLPVAQALLDNPQSVIAQAFGQGAPTEVLGK